MGEELRTVGIEGQLDWLGTRAGHGFDLALTGAVFGWNDPAGVVIRYDSFAVDSESDEGEGAQRGHAWTAGYVFEPNARWKFTLEWLRVTSDTANRALLLGTGRAAMISATTPKPFVKDYLVGAPRVATETQVQLAVRFALGSLAR